MKTVKFLAATAAALFVCNVQAQELKKTVLGIEDFTYSSAFQEAEVEMVRNQIVNAIQSTKRVIVVDHNSSINSALKSESERRKQESAMDANTVADMTTLNANSLLTVHLDQLSVTKEKYEDYETRKVGDKYEKVLKGTYPYYKATISYTVKITDCETGAVQCQENFTYSDGRYSTLNNKAEYETPEAARKGIMSHCVSQDAFSLLILNTFKAEGKVLQIDQGDTKKAKTVYISLGTEDGIETKQILEVFKEIDVAGEVSRKLIGEVEVLEIMGSSRCLAKVRKGGDVIQQTMAAGGKLPVRSRDVKQKFFGGVK